MELVIWIKAAVGRYVRLIGQSNQPCAAPGYRMNHRIVKTGSFSAINLKGYSVIGRNLVTLEGAFPKEFGVCRILSTLIPEFPDQTFEGSDRSDIFPPHIIISIVN